MQVSVLGGEFEHCCDLRENVNYVNICLFEFKLWHISIRQLEIYGMQRAGVCCGAYLKTTIIIKYKNFRSLFSCYCIHKMIIIDYTVFYHKTMYTVFNKCCCETVTQF